MDAVPLARAHDGDRYPVAQHPRSPWQPRLCGAGELGQRGAGQSCSWAPRSCPLQRRGFPVSVESHSCRCPAGHARVDHSQVCPPRPRLPPLVLAPRAATQHRPSPSAVPMRPGSLPHPLPRCGAHETGWPPRPLPPNPRTPTVTSALGCVQGSWGCFRAVGRCLGALLGMSWPQSSSTSRLSAQVLYFFGTNINPNDSSFCR